MKDPAYRIDVVIPTHDTRELTLRCVESIQFSDFARAGAVRCIVVDNASADGTADAVAKRWPAVDVVRRDFNVGFGEACNLGASRGEHPLLLFLNSDVEARAGALERLAAYLVRNPEYVAVGGRLVDSGSERTQIGFMLRGFPHVSTQVALLLGLERYWPTNPISRRQLMLDFDYGVTQSVDAQPAGACLLCRRQDFDAIGGFDEAFFYWFEDVDLVRRLRVRGRIAYVHDAVFEHVGGGTFAQWPRPDVVVTRYRSMFRYFAKHHSTSELRVLRSVVGVLAIVRALALWPVDRDRARAYATVVRIAARPPAAPRSPRTVEGA